MSFQKHWLALFQDECHMDTVSNVSIYNGSNVKCTPNARVFESLISTW